MSTGKEESPVWWVAGRTRLQRVNHLFQEIGREIELGVEECKGEVESIAQEIAALHEEKGQNEEWVKTGQMWLEKLKGII